MGAHITFVLDSSGSMHSISDDAVGGFNSFLDEQRTADGEATVSLFEFDDDVTAVYRRKNLIDVEDLTSDAYQPGGRTALHDAMIRGMSDTETFLGKKKQTRRPFS